MGDGPCALSLLGSLCSGSLYRALIWRDFHGAPVADPTPGSLLLQPPWQDRVFRSQFTRG